MVADGIHSVSDLVSDVITIITVRIGAREADERMHYGYRRVETVGALFVSLLLVLASGELIVNAFHASEQATVEGLQLLVALVAALAVVTKEVLFQVTQRLGIKLSNPVLIANAGIIGAMPSVLLLCYSV